MSEHQSLWIMIAGPYRSGSTDPAVWAGNLEVLNDAAYAILQKGHVPIIGVNMALPIIENAGEQFYDSIMMPLSLALTSRCDAILRIGGTSHNADLEVAAFKKRGLPIFSSIDAIPSALDSIERK